MIILIILIIEYTPQITMARIHRITIQVSNINITDKYLLNNSIYLLYNELISVIFN